jgi:AcrR family transcriptional regulator
MSDVMDIVTGGLVSGGTFYLFFDDKQGFFFALAEELTCHEVDEAKKARDMIVGAPDFKTSVRAMVTFLEMHFERMVQYAQLYRALHNSGVVDDRRDHAWVMKERAVKALAEQLGKSGSKDTTDLDSLARLMMGAIGELRYAMIHTGKPTPAQAARLVTRFLQGGMVAYATRDPRHAALFTDEWREALDDEAPVRAEPATGDA